MSDINDYEIVNVLKKYNGAGGDVVIPDSITSIGVHAFADCEKLTIHAPAGSRAEEYAKEDNIAIIAE